MKPLAIRRDEPLTPERRAELQKALADMKILSDAFYWNAMRIGVHPFIEFCGMMNQYINLCEAALRDGVDFGMASVHSGVALPIVDHQAKYLGEKFGCIFGPTLGHGTDARDTFLLEALGIDPDPAPDSRRGSDY